MDRSTDELMGRRYKAYTAETGISYRYFFAARRQVVRPEGQGSGSDYIFVAMADQRTPLVLRVFVSDRATSAWQGAHGHELGASEQYAAAKMRLFRGLDEHVDLRAECLDLVVDETNVEDLLAPLDLV